MPVRMAIINKSTNNSADEDVEKGEPFCTLWVCRLVRPLWKAVWRYLKKLKMGETNSRLPAKMEAQVDTLFLLAQPKEGQQQI